MSLRSLWSKWIGEETPDIPTSFCYICKRSMRSFNSNATDIFAVRVCPAFHYAVVAVVGSDVRGSNVVLEALPSVRSYPVA